MADVVIAKVVKSPYLNEKSSDFVKFCTQQHIWNLITVTDQM